MAKVYNNIITHGLSGSLGDQIVFRKGKGGQTIVAIKPSFSEDRVFNPSQLAQQEAFRNAIAYAKAAKDQSVYLLKAQGTTMSAFNAAVADWFRHPEVLEIDGSNWNGEAGQTIRVKAQDDTFVSKVHVAIIDNGETVLEEGDAVRAEGLWWEYTTQTQTSGASNPRISAIAEDLPGNRNELSWANN